MSIAQNSSIKIIHYLINELNLLNIYPVLGAELEFFLMPLENKSNHNWQAQKLKLDLDIDKERGKNQFEFRTNPTNDVFKLIDEIKQFKIQVERQALKQEMQATFLAKPFKDQPGNALHLNIHLENKHQDNLFYNGKRESTAFLNSIGGLCKFMPQSMILFAPYEEAYLRYNTTSPNAPSKICWGRNNRSAAIRIPRSERFNLRIEHRVSCADSNPAQVIAAILFAIIRGIELKITPSEPIYGNAFLEQYHYPLLPTYHEAIELFNHGELKKVFSLLI